jgi:hypothetical protein
LIVATPTSIDGNGISPQGAPEAVPGGWGIGGHAHTDKKIVQTARKLLGKD